VGLDILTQPASLRADHEHSRFVVMRSVPDPPAGGNDDVSACTCSEQRSGVGDVTVVDDEPQATASGRVTIAAHVRTRKDDIARPMDRLPSRVRRNGGTSEDEH